MINISKLLKKVDFTFWHLLQIKSGEMIQSLRALAALPEYQGSIIWEHFTSSPIQFLDFAGP